MLASMRQISDVVLVHDELALTDPPANDEVGYYKLAGAEVITEGGMELGRVRCGCRTAAESSCRSPL